MGKDKLADIDVEVLRETDKAWCVHDGVKSVWVPKSQAEIEITKDRIGVLTLPEWLAVEKGLV
jgi:hypothetical protein